MTAEREKRLIETLGGMCVAAAMVVRDAAKSGEMPSREDCAREFNDAVLGAAKPIMEMFAADRSEIGALRAALVGAEADRERLQQRLDARPFNWPHCIKCGSSAWLPVIGGEGLYKCSQCDTLMVPFTSARAAP